MRVIQTKPLLVAVVFAFLQYLHPTGTNTFLRLGTFLYSLGNSKTSDSPGTNTSIAPNDSGAPVLSQSTQLVIGIASKSTVPWTFGTVFPALSISTLIMNGENRDFIQDNVEKAASQT